MPFYEIVDSLRGSESARFSNIIFQFSHMMCQLTYVNWKVGLIKNNFSLFPKTMPISGLRRHVEPEARCGLLILQRNVCLYPVAFISGGTGFIADRAMT